MNKEKLGEFLKRIFEEGKKERNRKFTLQNAHIKMTEDSVEFFTEEGRQGFNKLLQEELEKQSLELFKKDDEINK